MGFRRGCGTPRAGDIPTALKKVQEPVGDLLLAVAEYARSGYAHDADLYSLDHVVCRTMIPNVGPMRPL
jgi:hypothetical protein